MKIFKRLKLLLFVLGIVLLVLVVLKFSPTKVNGASVSGVQLRPQVWSGTVRITGDVLFVPWVKLTVLPGTKVLFEKAPDIEGTAWTKWADEFIKEHADPTGREGYKKSHFNITGKIIAQGTPVSLITFTSAQPKPEYADWDEIILLAGSRLEYVELSYAHNGANISGKNVAIKNSKIHDSLWSCVDIFSTGNIIENNEVYHCWHQGIGFKVEGENAVRNNYVHDAQLSFNCENGSRPNLLEDNKSKAAPLAPTCPATSEVVEMPGPPEVAGGTYGGKLIYPASE